MSNWRRVVFDYRFSLALIFLMVIGLIAFIVIYRDSYASLIAILVTGLLLMAYLNAGYSWWERKVQEYRSMFESARPKGPWG